MAVIRSKMGKRGYVIDIKDLKLKTCLRTEIKNRNEANAKLREIQTRLYTVKQDKSHDFWTWELGERRDYVKDGIVPVVQEEETEEDQPLRMVAALELWVGCLQAKDSAETTIASYQRYINKAIEFLGDRALELFTTQDIQAFIDDYKSTPIKSGQHRGQYPMPTTQRKYIDHLGMLWSHHIDYGVPNLNGNIFKPVQIGKRKASMLDLLNDWDCFESRTRQLEKLNISPSVTDAYKSIIFTKPQWNELYQHLKTRLWDSEDSTLQDKQLFAALVFCFYTGVRRSELPRVRLQDIDIDYGEIMVLRMKGRKGHEFNRKRVPVHGLAMGFIEQVIEMIPNGQRSVFCENDDHLIGESFDETNNMSKADTLSRQYRKVLKSTKWENAVGLHKFRHSLASILHAEGCTKEQVKDQIGWADDAMYERYKHLDMSRQRSMIEQAFS